MLTFEAERLTEISKANIWLFLVVYIFVMVSLQLFSALSFVVAAFVLLAALRGQTTVIFYALLIVPCFNIMNWVLFRTTFEFHLASKALTLLLCAMLIQQASAIRERYHMLRPFSFLIGYGVLMLVLSPFSLVPLVSALKAVFFLSFVGALIAMVSVMLHGHVHPGQSRSIVLAVCCIFILGSILVLPFPQISRSMLVGKAYAEGSDIINDTFGLYNGVAYHSQTLGPLLAVLNAFLLADYLFNLRRGGRLHQLLLCGIPILVYLTSSRTALLTYVGSTVVVWMLLSRSQHVPAARKTFMHFLFVAGLLLGTAGLVISSGFRNSTLDFLAKRTGHESGQGLRDDSIMESFTSSRMGMVEQQLTTFRQHPLIGTGFQVSEALKARGAFGWEVLFAATIEKGVLPTMILEESGVLGAVLMGAFFVSVIVTFLARSCYCFLSTFAAFLLTNMGEACFFSPSGGGGILWTICFCALLLDLHRIRYDQQRSRPVESLGTQANWTRPTESAPVGHLKVHHSEA